MALSTELLKKFKLEDVPLSDKLIAAKILFARSEFCYVNRKEEVVLEWLLESLNQELESVISSEIWYTLQSCLQSETMTHLNVIDINSKTKETLVKLLVQSLEAHVHGRTTQKPQSSLDGGKEPLIRECSVLILENNVFLYYFRRNIDSYVSLSQLVLKSAAESGDAKIFTRYLKSIGCFYDQSQSSYKIFIKNMLLPVVETFWSLKEILDSVSSCDNKLEEGTMNIENSAKYIDKDNVKTELLSLIQRIIFPSFLRKNLKIGLQHLFENKGLDSPVLHILYHFLVKNALNHTEVLSSLYSCVFEAFATAFKDDFNVVFHFFITLCTLCGLEIKVEKDSANDETCLLTKENVSEALNKKISEPKVEELLLILKEIVSVLKKAHLFLDDTIGEISFMKWMQALMIHLSTSFQTFPVTYSIITIIIELNPLIFAPISNKVLANVLLKPKNSPEEREQYKIFFHATFKTLLKVQPLQSFIRFNLLPTLIQTIEERRLHDSDMLGTTITDIIPDGFVSVFGRAVETISGHLWCISLVRVFSNMLTQFVVVPMEEGNFDGGHQLLLEVFETLVVPFLGGIRMAEQAVLEGTYLKFSNNFLELRTCLGRFGAALLQLEHCSKSLASFLHLCFAVGELQLLLLFYSPWSKQDEHLQIKLSANSSSVSEQMHLLSFLSHQQWNDIRQRTVDLGDGVCQKLLNSLLQQQLRTLVVFEKSIDMSKESVRILGEYLIESLESVQLLQNSSDVAIMVPLTSDEKLASVAKNIIVLLANENNKEILDLLKDPVLLENRPLLISFVWNIMQKIGNVLSKRKRSHSTESLKLNYRCLVRNMCESIRFCDLQSEKNTGIHEYFLEVGQKINEALRDLLQNDKMERQKIPLDLLKLLRYLVLLRSLPLPFLPQGTHTFVTLGILGVYVVLNEFSDMCSGILENQSEEDDTSQNRLLSIKNLCREILLGLMDGPSPVSFMDLVDVGLLLQLLHRDGQCPKLLLQLLFQDCIKKPEHLEKVVGAACLVDDHVKHNVNIDAVPIGALLLQLLQKKNLSHISEELRTLYQKNTRHLLGVLSQEIDSRMKNKNVSKKSVLALLSSFWCVLSCSSPLQFKMVIPYVDKFVSCSFSVLKNPDKYEDMVPIAEHVLEVVTTNHKRIGNVSGDVLWRTYETLNRPQLVTKMLKNAALPDFKRVLEDICHSLKPDDKELQEFPDLRLPASLVTMPMGPAKALSVEQMVVLVSSVAFDKVMEQDSRENVPDFLAFLSTVARRTKVPLPFQLADIILRTIVYALSAPSLSSELALSTSTIVIQLLSKMVLHHFPLLSDRIPAFMVVYRMVVHTVVINSAVELQLSNEEAEKFSRCALEIEQLSKSLSQYSLAFKAVSQHLVADMLQELEETTIHHKVKFHIMNSLYALMDLCDRFAFAHLNQALGPASLELFKTVRSNYRKFYRYSGKV